MPGLPLNRFPDGDPGELCKGCERRHSKPGFIDPEVVAATRLDSVTLLRAASAALDFEQLGKANLAVIYPVQPEAWQWAAIKALLRARAEFDAKESESNRNDRPGAEYSSGSQAERLKLQMGQR